MLDYGVSGGALKTIFQTFLSHKRYLSIERNTEERCTNYQNIFEQLTLEKAIKMIRNLTNKSFVLGDDKFINQIEAQLNRRVKPKPRESDGTSEKFKQKNKVIPTLLISNTAMNKILYNKLTQLAKEQDFIAYGDAASLVGLSIDKKKHRRELYDMLDDISLYEHKAKRPMLTALIVHKGIDNKPGQGFYTKAKELGYYDGSKKSLDQLDFWVGQVEALFAEWTLSDND